MAEPQSVPEVSSEVAGPSVPVAVAAVAAAVPLEADVSYFRGSETDEPC